MIKSALETIANELDEYLRLKFRVDNKRVVLSNIVNQDGSIAITDPNKIVFTLVSIHEEKVLPNAQFRLTGNGPNPPVCINLNVLVSAYFTASLYPESLRFLSVVIGFFQNKNVFDSQSSPGLDSGIDKIIFDIQNLSFNEQSNLWASLGAKYLPSVLYRVRMVVIEESMLSYDIASVSGMDADLNGK